VSSARISLARTLVLGQSVLAADATALFAGNCGQDDLIENNDSCTSSVSIGPGTPSDLYVSKTDDDWYRVTVPVFSRAYVQAIFSHAQGDVDLRLFDACDGTQLDAGLSAADNEQVSVQALSTPLQVLVLVEMFDGAPTDCNRYDLVVSFEPGTPGNSYCPAVTNSTGYEARTLGNGSSSIAANDLTLVVGPVPAGVPGIVFHGPRQVLAPFGNKVRCVGFPIRRSTIQAASGTNLVWPVDSEAWPEIRQGAERYFQGWFRDPDDPEGFGLSSGYAVIFTE